MSGLTIQALVRRVDLFTLKLFLSAIDEGQIGRAAAREYIAPSAATKRIQDLEELAGVKLFDRNAKGVVPSPAGLVVARHVRSVLAALDDMRRELSAYSDGIRGHVTVAAPRLLIVQFLAAEIGRFTRRFPLVDVALREETNLNVLRTLTSGEVDLAVFSQVAGAEDPDIESQECRSDRLVAAVPVDHPFAALPALSLEQVLEQDLVGVGANTSVMVNLRHAARHLGRQPNVKYSVSTVEAARSLVSAGLGIALQPASMLFLDDRDRVTTVPLTGQWAERSYRVGTVLGKVLTPAAQALVAQLVSPEGGSADEGLDGLTDCDPRVY